MPKKLAVGQNVSGSIGLNSSRHALHRYLVRLRAEADAEAWLREPMTPDEGSLAEVADWGPAEDWGDWADEKG